VTSPSRRRSLRSADDDAAVGAAAGAPVGPGAGTPAGSAAGRREARWHGALDLLEEVRREPGLTRAEAARRLGLGSGSATEIAARLRAHELLVEAPAPISGRGRPTTTLHSHPRGPVVAAVDIRYEDWRCAVAHLDGTLDHVATRRHASREAEAVLGEIAATLRDLRRRYRHRLRAVSVAVAGTVRSGRLMQAAALGWGPADLSSILPDPALPLLVGNDATLAGVAEARDGAGRGLETVLHLTVEVGIGGVLVVGGVPISGSGGAGGEYGHLPLGDRSRRCPCGAYGCWDLEVDGRALARHLGAAPPADPRRFARAVLADAARDEHARAATQRVAAALAAGIAGLVNAHAPDAVTLGGLAAPIRAVAEPEFEAAYLRGLMAFRRLEPTPLYAAALGEDGVLTGAAASALDLVLCEAGLTAWAAEAARAANTAG
jgi:predicted NBD/HSP70 family sugar kinase